MKPKVYAIDIDGTICSEERTFERSLAKPLEGAVEFLRDLKESGHIVILWTARGWEQYRVTKKWLDENGIHYDQIIMGKPIVDYFIDDRAISFTSWEEIRITQ